MNESKKHGLEIRTIGHSGIFIDGEIVLWRAELARTLVFYLLTYPHGRTRDQIIDAFLPGRVDSHSLERWELVEWLQDSLAQLNERCRALLVALYFDENEPSYQAIAKTLAIAEGSIGPTRARCLQQLRKILDAEKK